NNSVIVKMDKDTNYNLEYWVRIDAPRDLYVPPKDMLHIKFFSVDGIRGRSPLHSLKHDLNTQDDSKKFMSRFFTNGTHNGGILKMIDGKLSNEAREKLRSEWDKAYAGMDSVQSTVEMDGTVEYEPIKLDTEVVKLIR